MRSTDKDVEGCSLVSRISLLKIGACDGKMVIYKKEKWDKKGINSKLNIKPRCRKTPETRLEAHEFFGGNLSQQIRKKRIKPLLTQNQIIKVLGELKRLESEDLRGAFFYFVFKSNRNRFVVRVYYLIVDDFSPCPIIELLPYYRNNLSKGIIIVPSN